MTLVTITSIAEMAQKELEGSKFMENPYFVSLSEERLSREQFLASQLQFFHAVRHFSRPMMSLLSRMSNPMARLALLHNVVEEHGEFEPGDFHETTFRKFLSSLGHPGAHFVPPGPEVDAFNLALTGVCTSESVTTALCCLGVIEYAFADVSALIGQSVVQRGWVSQENLVHYSLHAEIDLRHAAELFEIAEKYLECQVEEVERGLRLGRYIFARLYSDLYAGVVGL